MHLHTPEEDDISLDAARRTLDLEISGLVQLRSTLEGPFSQRFLRACALIEQSYSSGGRIIVSGMGKSGHIGRKAAATFASTGTPAYFVHPGEASHGDLGMVHETDVVLALSWSGEAPELSDIIAYTRRFAISLIAITSRQHSALGQAADVALVLPKMDEACPNGLAPTTSTTMQLAVCDALAVARLSARRFTAQEFRNFHPGGRLGAQLKKVRDVMHTGDNIPVVSIDAILSTTIVEISGKRFGIAAVTDADGGLVGAVTDGDLRRAFSAGFNDKPVVDVMSRNPRTISPEHLAQEALSLMTQAGITSLFVVERDKIIGIIHVHDLLRTGVA